MQFCYGYDAEGPQLTAEDAAKVARIMDFYQSHNSSLIFFVEEYKADPNDELEAQAMLDLNLWSNAGEPRFTITDINTGRKLKAAGNGGGRPRKHPML